MEDLLNVIDYDESYELELDYEHLWTKANQGHKVLGYSVKSGEIVPTMICKDYKTNEILIKYQSITVHSTDKTSFIRKCKNLSIEYIDPTFYHGS